MHPVESSNIAAIGHDAEKNILRVRFKNGGLYEYDDVSQDTYQSILMADSVGSAFHRLIKAPGTPLRKIEG